MPKSSKESSNQEELSSDGSEHDDGRESDEEYKKDDNYGESDGDHSDDGDNRSGSDRGSGSDSGSNRGSGSDSGSNRGSGSDHGSGSDSGSNRGSGSDSGGDSRGDSESESESGYEDDEFNDEEAPENPRYVVNERYADDDEDVENKDDAEWWEGRERIIAAILLCWCCLCLIVIGVVLGVVLGGKNEDALLYEPTMAPTDRPTFAPQPLPPSQMTSSPSESLVPTFQVTLSPTLKPTRRPTVNPTDSLPPTISIPDLVEVIADQDTYLAYNVSKEFEGEEYGDEDTMLVQNGPLTDDLLFDSIAVMSFPMDEVPVYSRVKDIDFSAVLRLTHQPIARDYDFQEVPQPDANYTIIRIPETRTKMEFWHGFYFVPPEDDDEGVLVGQNTFTVTPGQSSVTIRIEDLLYDYELVDNKKPEKMFLMIENRGLDQFYGGDRFYTRKSDNPPTLVMNFVNQ